TLQTSSGNADITVASGSHFISAPLLLAGNTNIVGGGVLSSGAISNSGALSVQTSLHAGNIDGAGSVSVTAGKSLSANRVRQNALVISGAATINPNGSEAAVSRVGSLAIAGSANAWTAKLDMT